MTAEWLTPKALLGAAAAESLRRAEILLATFAAVGGPDPDPTTARAARAAATLRAITARCFGGPTDEAAIPALMLGVDPAGRSARELCALFLRDIEAALGWLVWVGSGIPELGPTRDALREMAEVGHGRR
jgi:hypothetical protein